MTGANVSGRVRNMMIVHVPAKIIMIQNTQRHPRELSTTLVQATILKTQQKRIIAKRQAHKDPTIGPNTGPMKTQVTNKLVAGPRPAASHMSAMTPTVFIN